VANSSIVFESAVTAVAEQEEDDDDEEEATILRAFLATTISKA